eukprot:tig00021127_g18808.t1
MASVQFTPLTGGALSEQPLAYLLEIDDFCILLDCGWNDEFDPKMLEPLKKVASKIDAVLLSHPDITHLGALPYAVGKLGMRAPVYATYPVIKMGQMAMYDAHESRKLGEEFALFSLDDVDAAFELCQQVKYSQHVKLKGKGAGVEVTPYAAGHMLGGTVWKIGKENEEIVYAVDYNHRKERCLNGTVLETFTRPTLLITDARNALQASTIPRGKRDQSLIETILPALRRGGSVLIPTDAAGRSLEILLLLDAYWTANRQSGLAQYPIVFLHKVAYRTVSFAQSMIEWCSDEIVRAFNSVRENPFQFRNVRLVHDREELARVPHPMVLLATPVSLDCGFSQQLLAEWGANPANSIILPSRGPPGSLAERLLAAPRGRLRFPLRCRVPLEGAELEEHLRREREEREREERKRRLQVLTDTALEDDDEEPVVEIDEPGAPGPSPAPVPAAAAPARTASASSARAPAAKRKSHQQQRVHKMYRHLETRRKWDDYGEVLDPALLAAFAAASSSGPGASSSSGGPGAGQPADGDKADGGPGASDFEALNKPPEAKPEVPTKCVVREVEIDVRAGVTFIDFEGRSDGGSLKNILRHVAPRKIILVHGSEEATVALAAYCSKHIVPSVIAPSNGERSNVTSESQVYKVKLKESLMASLEFHGIGQYDVAYLDAAATLPEEMVGLPVLDAVPPALAKPHASILVGDVRLSDFKQVLSTAGVHAEFAVQNALLCNGQIVVRKASEQQRVVLEGPIGEDFFRVRSLLYDQYVRL